MRKSFFVLLGVSFAGIGVACSTGGGHGGCGIDDAGIPIACPTSTATTADAAPPRPPSNKDAGLNPPPPPPEMDASVEPPPVMMTANDAEKTFNTLIQTAYPMGRPAMLPAGEEPGADRVPSPVQPGQIVTISAPVPADTLANGGEVCIAFGDPSSGWCVPYDDTNNGSLEIELPADLCSMIDVAQVCHDIRCYESATVDGQTFTQTTVQPLLAACGGCDEPTCADLLEAGICECASNLDCLDGKVCSEGVCVVEGVLRFSAKWDTQLDIDLHVIDPDAEEIYYGHLTSLSGGELDHDDQSGGPGTIENAAWALTAPTGSYTYWVENYDGGEAGTITLSVYENGVLQDSQSISVGINAGDESTHYTYDYAP